ncbi:MAG: LysM peptidoglycan-binding domain-containing protein [Anaerolineaceae bacterium]|jgi:nucleoid-associated protein YgaU|nr:LysM peptidoglycan-binding domain-containing protein [Anaerolineaceae bacterium]MDD4042219.1 LysM peptidoglycan-binding domain-containing protein [Anaerolineaceae bacterium]MDD4577987.1 LysM peptidoglycan-binding domain-containing protein [Anaerolineaceae bacterium]
MADDKKGIFGKLFGKKEEAEEAAKEVAKDVKSEAEIAAENARRVAEAAQKKAETEARKAEYEAEKLKNEAEAKLEEAKREAREKMEEAKEAAKEKLEEMGLKKENLAKQMAEKAAAAYIDNYTVQPNDTLSHIAMRFYGKATPAYYTLIYEHNKDVIGGNMNLIKAGQVLRIPALPEDLK